MKIKILILIILIVSLIFSGCVEESESSKNNKDTGADATGWHLKEVRDYDEWNNTHEYYTYDVIYIRGNITTITYGSGGQEVRVRTTYDIPPDYIMTESNISINVKKEGLVVNHGGLGLYDTSSIIIDFPEYELGYASSSIYRLSNPTHGEFFVLGYGDDPGTIKEAVFSGTAPAANAFNGNFSITFQFITNGAKYGTEYVYEWRD